MRTVQTVVLIAVMFALAACSTTRSARKDMESKWIGRSAEAFFLAHGAAKTQNTLAGGGTVYIWEKATRSTGDNKPIFCIAIISTDASGKIQRIRPNEDAIGKWKTSSCGELFS